tara:strand:- start:121 stop:345 length:225 start_codon:yes stop_codon:yes gene_type:complete
MGRSQKIASLLGEKQKIEKEIAKLQQECKHSAKSVKSIRENVDSTVSVVRWVCDDCNTVVGIPNNDDLQNYLKQ